MSTVKRPHIRDIPQTEVPLSLLMATVPINSAAILLWLLLDCLSCPFKSTGEACFNAPSGCLFDDISGTRLVAKEMDILLADLELGVGEDKSLWDSSSGTRCS